MESLRALYPDLDDETLKEAGDIWDRYLLLVLKIQERLLNGPGEIIEF